LAKYGAKFLTYMTQYLQFSGAKVYLTEELRSALKTYSPAIYAMRNSQKDDSLKGVDPYRIIEKVGTLDNNIS
jgi:hypothetical protein